MQGVTVIVRSIALFAAFWGAISTGAAQGPEAPDTTDPDVSEILDILDALPDGDWFRANLNRFEDVWAPPELEPLWRCCPSSPRKLIEAWGSFAWDRNRADLWIYGGGNANSSANDIYRWRATTRMWERAAFPSEVRTNPDTGYLEPVDGMDNAPLSAHTYDNNIFLPVADRFVSFGGAATSTFGSYLREDDSNPGSTRRTGPYFFDPDRANGDRVGGTTGSHVQREGPYPEIVGGRMWENRDSYRFDWGYRGIPSDYLNGSTGYTTVDGKDVVYVSAASHGTNKALYRYTIHDVDDSGLDTWEMVGRFWNGSAGQGGGAYDAERNIFVRTQGEVFVYWDLDHEGPQNDDVEFVPEDPGQTFTLTKHFGMDFDPVRERFVLWDGTGAVWALVPPATIGPEGWIVVRQPAPESDVPNGDTATGILGKWEYAPNLDAFVGLQDEYDGNVWIYKPVGWQRPDRIPSDRDGDGMPDDYETAHGLDPDDPLDAGDDPDRDSATNLEEYRRGTDPWFPDFVVPEIDLVGPAGGRTFLAGETVTLTARVFEANGTMTGVTFFAGNTVLAHEPGSSDTFVAAWTAANTGTFDLRAVATDPVDGDSASIPVTAGVEPQPGGRHVSRVLQDGIRGYDATLDTVLRSSDPDATAGASERLALDPSVDVALIRLPITAREGGTIPDGAIIREARLSLYRTTATTSRWLAFPVLEPWSEQGATWNSRASGLGWHEPGAAEVGADHGAAAIGLAEPGQDPGWLTFDVTDAVRAIVEGAPNHGWRLTAPGDGHDVQFVSSDSVTDPALRPRLQVVFTRSWQDEPRRAGDQILRGQRAPWPVRRSTR